MSNHLRKLFVVVLLACLCSCQLLTRLTDHQCDSDGDCVDVLGADYTCDQTELVCKRSSTTDAGPPALPEQWRCLRENLPTYPPLTAEDRMKPPLTVSLLLRDFSTGELILDSTGASCSSIDLDCSSPMEAGLSPDEEGYTNFTVPYGFTGRFRFTVPDHLATVVYISRPIYADYREHGGSPLSLDTKRALESRAKTEVPADSGTILFVLLDCDDVAAPGVQLISGNPLASPAFYFDGPFPDQDLSESRVTNALSYDGKLSAVGGFYDSPGFTSYEAKLADTGDLVSRVSVDVRSNEVVVVHMFPGDI